MDPTQQKPVETKEDINNSIIEILQKPDESSVVTETKISLEQLMSKMNKTPEQLKINASHQKVKNSESSPQKLLSPSSLQNDNPYTEDSNQKSESNSDNSSTDNSDDEKTKTRSTDPTKTKQGEDTPDNTTPRQEEKNYPGTPLRGTNIVVPSSGNKQKLVITPITIYQNEPLFCFGKLIVSSQKYMAYAMRGGVVRVIDKQTAKKGLLKGHGKTSLSDIKFMREDQNIVATAGVDGRIIIWQLITENDEVEVKILLNIKVDEEKKFFKLLTWHPTKDFQLVVVMSDNSISLLDVRNLMKLESPEIKYDSSMRGITLIQEAGSNTVTDVCFSKDSKLLGASFTNEGMVHIWEAINYSPVKKFSAVPDGKPAFSINFCGSSSNPEMIPYIIVGGLNNSSLSIWKRSYADYEHIQTVKLESGNNSILNHVELEPTSTFFITCDFKDSTCRILHLGKQDNGNYMFDYITEFETEQNTISFSTSIKISENRMMIGLFVFQPKAMRLLNVKSEQCYSAEHIAEQQAMLSPKNYSQLKGKESPKGIRLNVDTPVKISTPGSINSMDSPAGLSDVNSPILSQMSKMDDVLLSTPSESFPNLGGDLGLLYKKMEERINQMERNYEKRTEQTILKIFNKFENERKDRLKLERMRQEELMATISKVIEEELPEKLENILVPCLNDLLPNILNDQVSKKLDKSFLKMGEFVDKSLSKNVTNGTLGASISQSLQAPIKQSFSEVLKASVVPMFENSCQKMFGQISETFENGLEEQISQPLKQFYAEQNKQLLTTIEKTLSKGVQSNGVQQAPKQNIMAEIGKLVKEKQYDEAFSKATAQINLKVLNFVLTQVDPEEALSSQVNPIHSQPVILALMQQISCDLKGDIDLKLNWLEKISLSLNTEDKLISNHVSMILKQILDNMSKVFSSERSNPEFQARKFKLVMHLLNSLYKDTLIPH